MGDVFSTTKRSEVMSLIRGRGNKDTELRMIALMRAHGITGWRRHVPLTLKVGGPKSKVQSSMKRRVGRATGRVRPDFVFRREKVVVFVDGCFWHGCPKPKHAPLPKNRAEWWAAKLAGNKARDRLVTRTLRAKGWRVVRVWECALAKKHWHRIARQLTRALGRLE